MVTMTDETAAQISADLRAVKERVNKMSMTLYGDDGTSGLVKAAHTSAVYLKILAAIGTVALGLISVDLYGRVTGKDADDVHARVDILIEEHAKESEQLRKLLEKALKQP